jgi:uncharacterized DUF497 family protein
MYRQTGKAMFRWTAEKKLINKEKHGFLLSDIADVFDDPYLFGSLV